MDLDKTLGNVEGKDDLIKQINAEIGKEFVPRAEFNKKNEEHKSLQGQFGDLNTNLEALNKEKATHEQTVADLTGKIHSYEIASLKARIAHETGIPYELASRLTGDDEESIRKDAQTLSGLVTRQNTPPLLKSTEPVGDGKDSAYKALLSNIKGD